jgi:hypothetical protein
MDRIQLAEDSVQWRTLVWTQQWILGFHERRWNLLTRFATVSFYASWVYLVDFKWFNADAIRSYKSGDPFPAVDPDNITFYTN